MIPTAKEFLRNSKNINYFGLKAPNPLLDIMPFIETDLIEFAKLHVQEALKSVIENVDMDDSYYEAHQEGNPGWVDEHSILDAYDLNNIK